MLSRQKLRWNFQFNLRCLWKLLITSWKQNLQQLESGDMVHFFVKWWQRESGVPVSEWNLKAWFKNNSWKTIEKLRRWKRSVKKTHPKVKLDSDFSKVWGQLHYIKNVPLPSLLWWLLLKMRIFSFWPSNFPSI